MPVLAVIVPLAVAQPFRAESAQIAPISAEGDGHSLRWLARDGDPLAVADDETVLEFLESAEVVERTTLDEGKTRPQRLVLEKDGIRARAVFHDVDIVKDREKLSSGEVVYYFRDSYLNNVAVYELSRLLGVSNVPPAVIRRLSGVRGSVQLWIEDAHTEGEHRQHPRQVLPLEVRRRIRDMRVFDNLINNTDRNDGNMLYDSVGGFWMIDHTRTLSRSNELPSPERIRTSSRSLLAAMRGLDETETRERLAPFLSTFEIDALFSRRDKLVALIDQKIAENGEENVLFSYD